MPGDNSTAVSFKIPPKAIPPIKPAGMSSAFWWTSEYENSLSIDTASTGIASHLPTTQKCSHNLSPNILPALAHGNVRTGSGALAQIVWSTSCCLCPPFLISWPELLVVEDARGAKTCDFAIFGRDLNAVRSCNCWPSTNLDCYHSNHAAP